MARENDGFDRFFDFYFSRVYARAWKCHSDESHVQATTQQVLTALLLRAVPRGLAHAPDDRELQKLALTLVKEFDPPQRLRRLG